MNTPTVTDLMSFDVARTFAPVESAHGLRGNVVEHYSNDSATTAWLTAMRQMETEGERTPAQVPDIQIRADFPRKSFCLYVNGEPVGVSSQYKALWHARNFLLGEMA